MRQAICIHLVGASVALVCAAWSGHASAYGTIEVVNSLPVEVRCSVSGAHLSEVGPLRVGNLYVPPEVIPAFARISIEVSPLWPASPVAEQPPHHTSAAFSNLRLTCETTRQAFGEPWGHRYSAEFHAEPSGAVVDDCASDVTDENPHCSGAHVFTYPLTVVVPTGMTEFTLQLLPHDPAATALELQHGAALDVHLSAYALGRYGVRLHAVPLDLGRFALHRDASLSD